MTARPDSGLLHAEFQAQVERTPGAVALREGAEEITYRELAARAGELRARLGGIGVRAGSLVALHLEPSIDYVAALLAVLQTGAAALPLPPSYPEARRRDILSFSRFDAVIIQGGSTPPPPATPEATIDVADHGTIRGGNGPAPPPSDEPGDRPAFVLCSSGSTGKPKLIERSHASFFHRLRWTWREHPYVAGEACCLKSFMTTTHAVYELFEPLLRGVAVHIFSDAQVRDVEGFFAALRAKGITRLLVVPSLLRAALDLPGFVPPPLKVLVLMGEAVDARLADRVLQAFPRDTRLYSIYGSTEASSTVVCDLRASARPDGELPLGQPIAPEVRLHVLDAEGEPVAPGQAGRLHVAGPALFAGYFRDPELTAAVVRPGSDGQGRLYDTRDQVRLTKGGELRFVGRVDDTVKVRGFRVDLGEVERILGQQRAVREAAVVARPGDDGTTALVGFFAPAAADPAELFAALRQALPAYMVPSALGGLDSLPRTPNGKLDRRRLADLPTPASSGASPAQPRLTPTEREVLEVWRGVLGHDHVRLDSQFFEVGGTSLSVFTALRRLRERPGLEAGALSEQAFYRYPSPAALAAHIDALRGRAVEAAARNAVLVTLKKGEDAELPPLFLVSSAGGTLGAYHKLAGALRTRRQVVGVRDPFLWGERDPTGGFRRWVAIYQQAIRERQPRGPYFIGAYSSAAVFGYELAQGLHRAGERVELLALVDPLAFDRASRARFGYWVLRARVGRPFLRPLVRLAGRLRRLAPRARRQAPAPPAPDVVLTSAELASLARRARESRSHILGLSALLELNSGLPFALGEADLAGVPPAGYLGVLLARVASVSPDLDPRTLENIVVQYYLQTGVQHAYRLQPFPGRLALFEPQGPHRGLFAAQFAPYVPDLRVVSLPLALRPDHARLLAKAYGDSLTAHYLSMRDDAFVSALAAELDRLL